MKYTRIKSAETEIRGINKKRKKAEWRYIQCHLDENFESENDTSLKSKYNSRIYTSGRELPQYSRKGDVH